MLTEREDQFYIGGKWQESGDANRLPVVNPASERVVGHIARAVLITSISRLLLRATRSQPFLKLGG